MDFGIDTLIYIVLGVVFIVAQVAKKKKTQAVTESTEEIEEREIPQKPSQGLLEQLMGFDEVEDPFDMPSRIVEIPPEETVPLSSKRIESEVLPYKQFGETGKEVKPFPETIEISEDQKGKAKTASM